MEFNGPNRIREKQIFFQKPSQDLLFLRGPKDKVIYGVLCGLIVAGTIGATYKGYLLVTGQKPAR